MNNLGIDLQLLLTQIVNFLIVMVVLTKFLYRPILKKLAERRKKIEEGLAWSEKAALEEEKLNSKKQEFLKKAREEARAVISEAKKDAQVQKQEIIESGKKEVADMKQQLEKEMAEKLMSEEKTLSANIVDIAYSMTKQVLADVLTKEDQQKLVKKQLQTLEKQYNS